MINNRGLVRHSNHEISVYIHIDSDRNMAQENDFSDNLKRIKPGSWVRSPFITSGQFYQLIDCDDKLKLSFKCNLCKPNNKVVVAYARTSGNLRVHIQVST